jgi:CBS domain containing-hemolysin-like protein
LEDPISTPVALLAVILLVLANGFFVATEFALVAVRRTRVQQLAAEGSSRARSVLGLLDHLDTYIAATQLGITISSIGLGWIGEPAIARLIEPGIERLAFLPDSWRGGATHTVAFLIAFSIITALHIVFGELAPKSLALQRAEATSLWVAAPIRAFEVVFRPIIFALNGVGNAVVRLFGIQPAAGHTLVQSAEELKLAIDASREAGLVEEAAHDLVDRAFLFTDLDVRHAMVPRTEVTAIPVDASLMEIMRLAAETNHTRLPVYERDNDHIVGVVNIKRLLPLLYEGERGRGGEGEMNGRPPSPSPSLPLSAPFNVRNYMREVFAVPETVPAPDVLERMRQARVQLAVVVDEYGGTAGIVTLEDLVESLVGEIEDESALAEPPPAADGSLVLDGLTTLVEAKEYFDLDLEGTLDVETVGGWVFGVLGRPAVIGDEVSAPDGRIVRVEELDGLRVARVRVLPSRDQPAGPHEDAPNATAATVATAGAAAN